MAQNQTSSDSDDEDNVCVDRIWTELYVFSRASCWLSWIAVMVTSVACFYTFFEAQPGRALVIGLVGAGLFGVLRFVKLVCEFMWAVAWWAGATYEMLDAADLRDHRI